MIFCGKGIAFGTASPGSAMVGHFRRINPRQTYARADTVESIAVNNVGEWQKIVLLLLPSLALCVSAAGGDGSRNFPRAISASSEKIISISRAF